MNKKYVSFLTLVGCLGLFSSAVKAEIPENQIRQRIDRQAQQESNLNKLWTAIRAADGNTFAINKICHAVSAGQYGPEAFVLHGDIVLASRDANSLVGKSVAALPAGEVTTELANRKEGGSRIVQGVRQGEKMGPVVYLVKPKTKHGFIVGIRTQIKDNLATMDDAQKAVDGR